MDYPAELEGSLRDTATTGIVRYVCCMFDRTECVWLAIGQLCVIEQYAHTLSFTHTQTHTHTHTHTHSHSHTRKHTHTHTHTHTL